MIKMKKLIIILIFLQSSCSSLANNFVSTDALLTIKNYISGYPDLIISYDDFMKRDSSFAVIKFGRGPSSIVSLAYIKNNIYEWRSNDGIKIFTKEGAIIKTVGLKHDMELNPSCLDQILAVELLEKQSCKLSFYNPDLEKAHASVQLVKKEDRSISRLGKNIFIKENIVRLNVPSIKWSKENSFYISDGQVISSIQHVHPRLPKMHIEYYFVY